MSLRWRIGLAMAGIVAIATIAVGVASYRSTSDRLMSEVDRSLGQLDGVLVDRRREIRLPTRGPFAGYDAQLVDREGRVVDSTLADPLELAEDARRVVGVRGGVSLDTVGTDGPDYRVRTVGVPGGAFQIARSLEETERILDSLRSRIVLLVVVVSLAAIAAGWLIADRATASLRRLTGAAEYVESTGDLDVRVHESGDDEVGRLSRAFDRMIAALDRSRQEQHRLVQDAGHELRTPLTSIRTNLDVLRRHADLPTEQRRQVIDDLHEEVAELSELVDEVITVASGDRADDPIGDLDLLHVAHDVAERFARRTGREIVVAGPASPVVGRRGAVARAIACLVDNAAKFDPSGGRIEISVGGGAVSVRDHGPGIPSEQLDLVFERFHRADEARSMPGSGLGLSIVHDVATRHGGEAFARNAPDGGAVVGFSLGSTRR